LLRIDISGFVLAVLNRQWQTCAIRAKILVGSNRTTKRIFNQLCINLKNIVHPLPLIVPFRSTIPLCNIIDDFHLEITIKK